MLSKKQDGGKQGTIHVVLLSAKDLPIMDKSGTSDPYVVIQIGKKSAKSKVCKNTLTPVWDESFEFLVGSEKDILTVSVFDWDRISSNDLIGAVSLTVRDFRALNGNERKWFSLKNEKKNAKSNGKSQFGSIQLNLKFDCLVVAPEKVNNPENVLKSGQKPRTFFSESQPKSTEKRKTTPAPAPGMPESLKEELQHKLVDESSQQKIDETGGNREKIRDGEDEESEKDLHVGNQGGQLSEDTDATSHPMVRAEGEVENGKKSQIVVGKPPHPPVAEPTRPSAAIDTMWMRYDGWHHKAGLAAGVLALAFISTAVYRTRGNTN